jgi:hypothetical protein
LGDYVFGFTIGLCKGFNLHALHRLHQPLASLWDVSPIIDYFSHVRFKSM